MPRQRVQISMLFYYNRHQKESGKASKVTKPVAKWKGKQGYETCCKMKRQARLRNLFQSEKTNKVSKLVSKRKDKQGYKTCFKVKRQARLRIHLQLAPKQQVISLPSPLGEGLGVRPVGGLGARSVGGKPFTLSPCNAVWPRLST